MPWSRWRPAVALQLVAGLACGGLGLSLMTLAGRWVRSARTGTTNLSPAISSQRAPRPPAPDQTLRPGAPPRTVGPRYDSDKALPARAKDVASYDIHARLDPSSHTVTAKATIHWTNDSTEPQSVLYFHLYLNAFKNDQSLFLRSPFRAGRSGDKAKTWGFIDVKRLSVEEFGGKDLWAKAARHSPGDPNDQTDIRVPLPQAVEPGQAITLKTEWVERLPEIVDRTGYVGSFYFVGQWFPKLARLSRDGVWRHFEFNPLSEFYADFGHYSVTLDVPSSMVVGATGVRVSERRAGARRILRYAIDNVHDFAWTAWDRFLERRARIDGVSVRVLYPPGNDGNADRELDAVRFCLPRYDRLYGRYPYPVLTLVHPPEWAENAGGMEYPTLITTGGPWYSDLIGLHYPEDVTIHELGHQWFYGLVATNEHRWPFLDEGVDTFAELSSMRAYFGEGSFDLAGFHLDIGELYRTDAARFGHDYAVALPAASFGDFTGMTSLVYSRTGTILDTLARVYGRSLVQKALGRYARRYRFAHPGPEHLIRVMREVLGDQAADNLRIALFQRGWVDYVARDLRSARVTRPAGIFDSSSGRRTIPRRAATEPARWLGRVLVFRHGTLTFPVDVELITKSGARVFKHWDGRGNSTSIDYEGTSPLVQAVVDPERRIALDENQLNNAVRVHRQPPRRSLERATYAAELLLGTLGP